MSCGIGSYWSYCSHWNLLDYPAVLFPVSNFHAGLDSLQNEIKLLTDIDAEHWKSCKCVLLDSEVLRIYQRNPRV